MGDPLATSPLPADVEAVFRNFRTCEFSTLAKDGTPLTWPTLPFWDGELWRFIVTTSIGFPQKAYNIRRDGRVSLLFSEPRASGMERPPTVLVQGDATAPDEILTMLAGAEEDGLRQTFERQPYSMIFSANPLSRYFSDWYYMRLLMYVTPRQILWWRGGGAAAEPQRAALLATDQPQGDKARPAAAPKTPAQSMSPDAFARLTAELATYPSAVLTGQDAGGYPYSVRCQPQPDAATGALMLATAAPLTEGVASLLCHAHDDKLANQRSFLTRGTIARDGAQWRFTPTQVIPGINPSPLAVAGFFFHARGVAATYLAKRNLPRPVVPWAEIIRIKHEAQANLRVRGERF